MTLLLKLINGNKQKVIDSIRILENYTNVYSASPNYIFYPDEHSDEYSVDSFSVSPVSINSDEYTYDDFLKERDADLYTYGCCAKKYIDPNKNNTVYIGIVDSGIYPNSFAGSKVEKYINCVNNNAEEYVTITCNDSGRIAHGTNVANVIGRNQVSTMNVIHSECGNNTCVGVCPNVKFYSLQIYDNNGIGYFSAMIKAIEYANLNNIKILNFSTCYQSGNDNTIRNSDFENIVSNYNGLLVSTASNYERNESGSWITYNVNNIDASDEILYPINCPSDNVIVVGNSYYNGSDIVCHPSSCYGQSTVDLFAMGYTYDEADTQSSITGTSFSTPRVAGAAAVLMNIFPDITPAQLRHYILAGVDASPDLAGKCVTGGSLNVYKSAKILISDLAVQMDTIFAGHFTRTDEMQVAAYCQVTYSQMKCYVWTYDIATGKFSDPEHWFTNSYFSLINNNLYRSVAGDFDNDEYTEICTLYDQYLFVEGNGFWAHPCDIDVSLSNFTGRVVAGDFDCDGRDEIAALYKDPNEWGRTKLYRWDFSGVGTGLVATQSILYDSGAGNYEASFTTDRVVAGDFDGDEYDEVAVLYSYPDGVYSLHKFDLYMYSAEYTSLIYRHGDVDVLKMTGRLVACDYNGGGDDEIVGIFDNSAAVSAGIINYGFRFSSYNNAWSATALYTSSENAYFASRSTNLVVSGDFAGNLSSNIVDGLDDIVTMYYLYDANGIPGRGKINICRNVANLDSYGEKGYKSVWDPLV